MPKPLPHHWRQLTRSQIVECARRSSNHSQNYNTSILELLKNNLSRSASHLNNILHSYITHTPHSLRNNDFRTALARTETFKSSFFPNMVKDWNILNPIVKSSTSIGMFKSHLRTEIFRVDQHCFDYNYLGTRKVNALLATMRTRCSVLKHDLFKVEECNQPSCEALIFPYGVVLFNIFSTICI